MKAQFNYDPNLTNCGRMAMQRVVLTFGQWQYRATMETEIGGNCTGMSVIECAVGNAFEDLNFTEHRGRKYSRIVMADHEGRTLECEDEDYRCEEWLKDMLISAEIVSIIPDID